MTQQRMDRNTLHMHQALLVAGRSTCERAQVGAVIVKDARIISSGYAGAPSGMPHCVDVGCQKGPSGGCETTVHAEANAVAFAARHGVAVDGCDIFCTMSPCPTCAKLIINSGITRVFYGVQYRKVSGISLLLQAGIEVWRDSTGPADLRENILWELVRPSNLLLSFDHGEA